MRQMQGLHGDDAAAWFAVAGCFAALIILVIIGMGARVARQAWKARRCQKKTDAAFRAIVAADLHDVFPQEID
ncbi:hypothetical protein JOL79_11610 [Microbispora sp. RL4-1S]|uniref:Uncharacterized protein n=1 Tax=Microbispora oryzae TaxID=2806554 RepID=A0A940WFC6_9ACTN|nr:hypothetical protein [Microbispora oryzae]MBP2704461.1 hypothetical protein [Microbispora oryzae]